MSRLDWIASRSIRIKIKVAGGWKGAGLISPFIKHCKGVIDGNSIEEKYIAVQIVGDNLVRKNSKGKIIYI